MCKYDKQERIPVVCVLSAAVAISPGGAEQAPPRTRHPPGPGTPPKDQPEIPNSCGIWYIRDLKSWAQLVICGEHITVF